MMRLHATFAISILCIGLVAADCPAPTAYICDPSILSCCNKQFTTQLNLKACTGSFLDSVECYRDEIEKLYGSGNAGTLKVTVAYNKYRSCMGISAQSCESIEWHVANGMNPAYAMVVSTVYSQLSFMNGAGLNTYFNNVDCMKKVFANSQDTLKQCRKTFSVNLVNNWASRCVSYRELIGCMQLPFERSCGIEAGWWGCEYQRGAVSVWLPECNEVCAVTNHIRAEEDKQ